MERHSSQTQVEEIERVQEAEEVQERHSRRLLPPPLLQWTSDGGRTWDNTPIRVNCITSSYIFIHPPHFRADDITGQIEIFRNGTDHVGPLGEKILMDKFHICKEREKFM